MSKIDDLIKELCPDGVKFLDLANCASIKRGKRVTKSDLDQSASFPVYSGGIKPMGYYHTYNQSKNTITVVKYGTAGFVNFIKEDFWANDVCYCIIPKESLVNKYLYYVLKNQEDYIKSQATDAIPAHLPTDVICSIKIPVPPLEVQKEIVRVLDSFTELEAELGAELEAELEARKKQYAYYRNTLLTFEDDKNITWVELGEVARYEQPTKYIVRSSDYNDSFSIPVLTAGKTFILGYTDESSGIYNASTHPVIIFDDFTTANKWVDFDFKVKSSAMKIITSVDESTALLKYIYHWLNTLPSGLVEGDHKRQWISSWSKKKIPIPSLEKQKQIVSILDKFEKLTNDISIGLPAEIEARHKQYEYYRNKLLTFKELECSR